MTPQKNVRTTDTNIGYKKQTVTKAKGDVLQLEHGTFLLLHFILHAEVGFFSKSEGETKNLD